MSCVEIVTHTVPFHVQFLNYELCTTNYGLMKLSGGYCSGVPPLPIPNREVKPACADGTAMQCGSVGSRRLFKCEPRVSNDPRLFFITMIIFKTY